MFALVATSSNARSQTNIPLNVIQNQQDVTATAIANSVTDAKTASGTGNLHELATATHSPPGNNGTASASIYSDSNLDSSQPDYMKLYAKIDSVLTTSDPSYIFNGNNNTAGVSGYSTGNAAFSLASQPAAGVYVAYGSLSACGTKDTADGVGYGSHSTVTVNQQVKAELWYSMGFSYGYTTEIFNGIEQEIYFFREDTDPATGNAGITDHATFVNENARSETIDFEFFTQPGDVIFLNHELDVADEIDEDLQVVAHSGGVATLELLRVKFTPN